MHDLLFDHREPWQQRKDWRNKRLNQGSPSLMSSESPKEEHLQLYQVYLQNLLVFCVTF